MNKITITPELVQAILELNPDSLISYLDVDNNDDGSTLAYVALIGDEAGDSKVYGVTQDDEGNLTLEESENGNPADLEELEDEAEENGMSLVDEDDTTTPETEEPKTHDKAKSDDDSNYSMSMCKEEMKSLSDRLTQLEGSKEAPKKESESIAKAEVSTETEIKLETPSETPKEEAPKVKSFFGIPTNLIVK